MDRGPRSRRRSPRRTTDRRSETDRQVSDAQGNLRTETRLETKNAIGKVASVTTQMENGPSTISYAYDADGNLTLTTDPAQNQVQIGIRHPRAKDRDGGSGHGELELHPRWLWGSRPADRPQRIEDRSPYDGDDHDLRCARADADEDRLNRDGAVGLRRGARRRGRQAGRDGERTGPEASGALARSRRVRRSTVASGRSSPSSTRLSAICRRRTSARTARRSRRRISTTRSGGRARSDTQW